jgi:hypothetical protein
MAHDLRKLARWAAGRHCAPTAVLCSSSTRPTTPESGPSAGYDGYKRCHGSKSRLVVDTLGHLLAIHVIPADVPHHKRLRSIGGWGAVQQVSGETAELTCGDQVHTGDGLAVDAAAYDIRLEVLKLPEAKRGFELLPWR